MMKTLLLGAVVLFGGLSHAVVGGKPVSANRYKRAPIVAIIHSKNWHSKTGQSCTAIALDARTLLTAAHCATSGVVRAYRTNDIDEALRRREDPYEISNRNIFIHPKYNPITHENDFAILKLKKKIYGRYEVSYPQLNADSDSTSYYIYGYGQDSDGNQGALKYAVKFKEELQASEMSAANFLVFDQRNGMGICSGDSGGPVFSYNSDSLQLIGLSTGVLQPKSTDDKENKIANCNSRGLISKISPVMDWIKSYL